MKQKRIFLILALLCTMVQAAWADITVTTESELRTAVQSSQTVKIGADINTASQGGRLDINNGQKVVIK